MKKSFIASLIVMSFFTFLILSGMGCSSSNGSKVTTPYDDTFLTILPYSDCSGYSSDGDTYLFKQGQKYVFGANIFNGNLDSVNEDALNNANWTLSPSSIGYFDTTSGHANSMVGRYMTMYPTGSIDSVGEIKVVANGKTYLKSFRIVAP